jgi:hypothetical protein
LDSTKEAKSVAFTYMSFPTVSPPPFPVNVLMDKEILLRSDVADTSKYIPPPFLVVDASRFSTLKPGRVTTLFSSVVMCNPPPFPFVALHPSIIELLISTLTNPLPILTPHPSPDDIDMSLIVTL